MRNNNWYEQEIDFHFSSSDHYCVNIVPEIKVSESCENALMLESEVSTESKYKQVKTIHTVWACIKR